MLLDFSDQTRTGIFNMIWPLSLVKCQSWRFETMNPKNLGHKKSRALMALLFASIFKGFFKRSWKIRGIKKAELSWLCYLQGFEKTTSFFTDFGFFLKRSWKIGGIKKAELFWLCYLQVFSKCFFKEVEKSGA